MGSNRSPLSYNQKSPKYVSLLKRQIIESNCLAYHTIKMPLKIGGKLNSMHNEVFGNILIAVFLSFLLL